MSPRTRAPVVASVLAAAAAAAYQVGRGSCCWEGGRTDVVWRRISQQHAKLCGVLKKNGRLGVFHCAGKEECFVLEQNMTFL